MIQMRMKKGETIMNSCKNLAKKYPAVLAVLSFFFHVGAFEAYKLYTRWSFKSWYR